MLGKEHNVSFCPLKLLGHVPHLRTERVPLTSRCRTCSLRVNSKSGFIFTNTQLLLIEIMIAKLCSACKNKMFLLQVQKIAFRMEFLGHFSPLLTLQTLPVHQSDLSTCRVSYNQSIHPHNMMPFVGVHNQIYRSQKHKSLLKIPYHDS